MRDFVAVRLAVGVQLQCPDVRLGARREKAVLPRPVGIRRRPRSRGGVVHLAVGRSDRRRKRRRVAAVEPVAEADHEIQRVALRHRQCLREGGFVSVAVDVDQPVMQRAAVVQDMHVGRGRRRRSR